MIIFWMVYPTRGESEAGFHRMLNAISKPKTFNKNTLIIETDDEKLLFICSHDEKRIESAPRFNKIFMDERVNTNLELIESRRK